MKTIGKVMLMVLLLVLALPVAAQRKVKVSILEKSTEQPLIGAVITYADNEQLKSPSRAVADTEGEVTIEIPQTGKCYYQVAFVGYNTLTGTIGNEENVKLFMTEDVKKLSDVVVTGSTAARPIKSSPVRTQVISGKQLVDAGYADLTKALQQETAGLNVQKVGFGNELSMQGLDARHVLFLQDGERLTGDMAGNLDYERFNIHGIDRIEIVKGASSTLYGSRASGAVINLITKKTTKPVDIQVGGRWAQMNERNYSNPQPKDFLYMFEKNSDRPNAQGWLSAGFNMGKVVTQSDVWYSSSDAFYMYQADNDVKNYTKEANPWLDKDVTVVSNASRSPMGIEGTEHISVSQKVYYDPFKNLSILVYGNAFYMNSYDLIQDMTFSQSRDWTVGGKVNYKFKDWFKITASLHADLYDRFKRHERLDYRTKVYKSRILQPRISISSQKFAGHDLILGIEHLSDELTSDRFNGDASHIMRTRALKETEAFLQDEWTANDQWMLSAGVRTNFSRAFGLMAMPKIAAKWTPSEHLAWRSNLSMGYRSPSIKELFFNWDHLGMFMIKGNEDLKPERTYYASLGGEYTNGDFFFSGNLYNNYFRRKIEGVWRIYDMQYNFEYTNLRNQNILGFEAILKWKFLKHFTLNGSYSFVNVSKTDGVQLNTTSPHAATASLDYKKDWKNYRLGATFSASYMGTKKFDVQDRLSYNGESHDAYFRCTLPQYVLCNISLNNTFYNKYKVILGVDNLFNYVPKTLGSGITMFNVPATTGARFHVQVELLLDEIIKGFNKKK